MHRRFHWRRSHKCAIVLNDADVGRVDTMPERMAKRKSVSMPGGQLHHLGIAEGRWRHVIRTVISRHIIGTLANLSQGRLELLVPLGLVLGGDAAPQRLLDVGMLPADFALRRWLRLLCRTMAIAATPVFLFFHLIVQHATSIAHNDLAAFVGKLRPGMMKSCQCLFQQFRRGIGLDRRRRDHNGEQIGQRGHVVESRDGRLCLLCCFVHIFLLFLDASKGEHHRSSITIGTSTISLLVCIAHLLNSIDPPPPLS
mmetsp:Transcript_23427/g.67510  ORF Transcript_23427/g.67510 Transcript_23427/m.67510 type:complete len:255 (+) Transcript_23427:641-1405(+)